MARALELPPSTVMSWITRKRIPANHIPAILTAAGDRGIALMIHDFFDVPESRSA